MFTAFFDTTDADKAFFSKALPGKKVFYTESIGEQHLADLTNVDVISVFVSSKVPAAILERLPKLKGVVTRSTGFDHVDIACAKNRNIPVCNVPAYGESTVAEYTFALLLALTRKIPLTLRHVDSNNYTTTGLSGKDLQDKWLGVVGGGKIGMHVVRIAKGFGMHVKVFDVVQQSFLRELLHFTYAPTLDDLLKTCDVISIHTPNLPSTKHMINMSNIKKVKKGAFLVNTARGNVVSAEALLYGLDKEILSAAALDVLEDEELLLHPPMTLTNEQQTILGRNKKIINHKNVIFSPHNAFNTSEALQRIRQTSLDNIIALDPAKKTPPKNCVSS